MKRKLLILVAVLTLALAACGGGSDDGGDSTETTSGGVSGNIAAGSEVYKSTCQACHGPDGTGLEGLGKPLAPSDFVADQTEEELASFIKVGRSVADPDNTTGVDMPPKGGNPSLGDQDLLDVSAYLQSLN